jgi:hypothetical protein
MPRDSIELPHAVEYLSILDEDGNLDEKLEPYLSTVLFLDLQRVMLLDCRLDERGLDSPLSESAVEKGAFGMAVNGLCPEAEFQFSGYSYSGYHQVKTHAPRLRWRSQVVATFYLSCQCQMLAGEVPWRTIQRVGRLALSQPTLPETLEEMADALLDHPTYITTP